ncbi:MAG: UDP-glucose 4-epimerase GalE [Bacteroidetes bacterium CG23_combo_of_CG06-09_8_20_14_all_32_9]|nr:MAG: UDP-glucose 4-epimerase GalE [Bacteroidetes bacterium CG23_combo_of_CG06-09_8_20_14_all_32_9]
MSKKILVTGGTGYIGSHTAVELLQKDYEVFIVDNLCNSHISVLTGIEKITKKKPHFTKLDLTDKHATEKYFHVHHDIDAIIHFAALKSVNESVSKPLLYYKNNLESLVNLLNNMLDKEIPSLVFSSSCTVYGQPDRLPVNEEAPLKKPSSPYGNTKQISEEIIRDTINSSDFLKVISLRYFNPIGSHPSALIGELPLGVPNNLVPFITQTAAGIRDQLKVFGDNYNTPDGTCIRDYINVVDLAKAHVVSVERLVNNKMNESLEIFNLGTGNGYSVLDVIDAFEKVSGKKLNYTIVGRRSGDVEQVWADVSKANEVLDWKTERNLEETMLSAWNWEKKYRGIH